MLGSIISLFLCFLCSVVNVSVEHEDVFIDGISYVKLQSSVYDSVELCALCCFRSIV